MGRNWLRFAVQFAIVAITGMAQKGPYKVLQTAKVGGAGGFDYIYADDAGRRLYIPRGAIQGATPTLALAKQQGTGNLAGEETARLPMPVPVLEKLERLAQVEDQLRMTIGDHPLGRSALAIVLQRPAAFDERLERSGWPDFTIARHSRIIARIAATSGSHRPAAAVTCAAPEAPLRTQQTR